MDPDPSDGLLDPENLQGIKIKKCIKYQDLELKKGRLHQEDLIIYFVFDGRLQLRGVPGRVRWPAPLPRPRGHRDIRPSGGRPHLCFSEFFYHMTIIWTNWT